VVNEYMFDKVRVILVVLGQVI